MQCLQLCLSIFMTPVTFKSCFFGLLHHLQKIPQGSHWSLNAVLHFCTATLTVKRGLFCGPPIRHFYSKGSCFHCPQVSSDAFHTPPRTHSQTVFSSARSRFLEATKQKVHIL